MDAVCKPDPEGATERAPVRGWFRWALPACWAGVPVFFVYFLTLSRGLFPGRSAERIAAAAGVVPSGPPIHPVWTKLTEWVAAWPVGDVSFRLNLFGAVCGALAVAVLGGLIERWILQAALEADDVPWDGGRSARPPHGVPATASRLPVRERNAVIQGARLGGWTAALALAFSVPFWSASTRLHVQPFEMLFLLVTVRVALTERLCPSTMQTLFLGALCGWGCIELPGFVLPALALFSLLILNRLKWDLRWENDLLVGCLVGAVCAGLVLMLHAGAFSRGSPGQAFSPALIGRLVRLNLQALGNLLPRFNGLWILLLAYVPMFASLTVARRAWQARTPGITTLGLCCFVTVLMSIFPTPVSSWVLTRNGETPFTMGSLAMAVTLGFLAAFWRIAAGRPAVGTEPGAEPVPLQRCQADPDDGDAGEGEGDLPWFTTAAWTLRRLFRLRPRLALTFAWISAGLTLIALGVNLGAADGRNGAFADALAQDVLDRLGPRQWIVTQGGPFDLHLRMAARERRQALRLLPLTPSPIGDPRAEVKRQILVDPGFSNHAARLSNALGLGTPAFVREWLALDTAAEQRLLAIGVPEVWAAAGRRPVADGFGFTGVRDLAVLRGRNLVEENQACWARMAALLARPCPSAGPAEHVRVRLQRDAGLAVNNLGVLLEDLDHAADARMAYDAALRINPDSISAQVNRLALSTAAPPARAIADLKLAYRRFQGDGPAPSLIKIVETFGEIRRPDVLARQGQLWLRLGEPLLGRHLIERALILAPAGSRDILHKQLADIARQQGRTAEARQTYLNAWRASTNAIGALLGLSVLALEAGEWETARGWIERARQAGAPEAQWTIPLAVYLEATGRDDQAIDALRTRTSGGGGSIGEWALLAGLLLKHGEIREVERRILPAMERLAARDERVLVNLVHARLLIARQAPDYTGARRMLRQCLHLHPDWPTLWDELLRLDLAANDRSACEEDVAAALQAIPDHPQANLLRGTWLLERGEREQAEDAFRRSLAAHPTGAAHNNLAETLRAMGRLDEAEQSARAALALDEKNWAIWDTLGCVLMDQGRLNEAEAALRQAVANLENGERVQPSLQRLANLRKQAGQMHATR